MSETTPTPSLPPGYEFIELIAHGGMSSVYLVRQLSLDREIALKVVHGEVPQGIRDEARLIAQLNHVHVISVFDTGPFEDGWFIAMEHAPGRDLAQIAGLGPLDEATAVEYIQQLLQGLGAAHERGLLHLDIKPNNVLLDENGKVKLLDFGLGALAASGNGGYGTPGYSAPELYDGRPADTRTDLYAVAMLLYDLVSGTLPDPDTGVRPDLPEQVCISQRLWRSFEHATADDPDERFPDAAAFAHDLILATNVTSRLLLPDANNKNSAAALNQALPSEARRGTQIRSSTQRGSSGGMGCGFWFIILLVAIALGGGLVLVLHNQSEGQLGSPSTWEVPWSWPATQAPKAESSSDVPAGTDTSEGEEEEDKDEGDRKALGDD